LEPLKDLVNGEYLLSGEDLHHKLGVEFVGGQLVSILWNRLNGVEALLLVFSPSFLYLVSLHADFHKFK
jgi:hypothetical protein